MKKEETDKFSLRIPILKEYIDNKNVKKIGSTDLFRYSLFLLFNIYL